MITSIGDFPQWTDVYERTYNMKSALIQRSGFTTKLFRSPGPLARNTWATAPYLTDGGCDIEASSVSNFQHIIQEFAESNNAHLILFKSRRRIPNLSQNYFCDERFRTFLLNIEDGPDKLFEKKLKGTRRTELRNAQSFNLQLNLGGAELLDSFYETLAQRWRELGTPIHSKKFFAAILDVFKDNSRIFLLTHQQIPVATAIVVWSENVLFHPYAASDIRFNRMKANSLLYWHIIKFGCANKLNFFDMGRSRIGQGTIPFKYSWGAEEIPLYYYYWARVGARPPDIDSRSSQILTKCWSQLPTSFTKLIGPPLIRGIL